MNSPEFEQLSTHADEHVNFMDFIAAAMGKYVHVLCIYLFKHKHCVEPLLTFIPYVFPQTN